MARGIFFKAEATGKKRVAGVDKAPASAYESYVNNLWSLQSILDGRSTAR
jgi:hypothetical protein